MYKYIHIDMYYIYIPMLSGQDVHSRHLMRWLLHPTTRLQVLEKDEKEKIARRGEDKER